MKLLTAFIMAAALIGLPLTAGAKQSVTGQLAKVFNEKVVGLGLAKNQQSVVELYVGDNGSWTILVTLTNGMSCIAAAGETGQIPPNRLSWRPNRTRLRFNPRRFPISFQPMQNGRQTLSWSPSKARQEAGRCRAPTDATT